MIIIAAKITVRLKNAIKMKDVTCHSGTIEFFAKSSQYMQIFEFSLNVFTEFGEFSDKKNYF